MSAITTVVPSGNYKSNRSYEWDYDILYIYTIQIEHPGLALDDAIQNDETISIIDKYGVYECKEFEMFMPEIGFGNPYLYMSYWMDLECEDSGVPYGVIYQPDAASGFYWFYVISRNEELSDFSIRINHASNLGEASILTIAAGEIDEKLKMIEVGGTGYTNSDTGDIQTIDPKFMPVFDRLLLIGDDEKEYSLRIVDGALIAVCTDPIT